MKFTCLKCGNEYKDLGNLWGHLSSGHGLR